MEGRTDIGGFFGLELPEYGNFPLGHLNRLSVDLDSLSARFVIRFGRFFRS